MSQGCQEELPVKRQQFYPSNFQDFSWFHQPVLPDRHSVLPPITDVKSIPEIPIQHIPVEDRYPYRYCSAQPSQYEGLAEARKLKKCLKRLFNNNKIMASRFHLNNIEQIPGYDTTTMTSGLQPFTQHKDVGIQKCHLPKEVLYPQFTPYTIRDEFDAYVVDQLYPRWEGSKYKKRLVYNLGPSMKR